MGKVLKINSEFYTIKAVCVDFVTIKQGNDTIAMDKEEAVKLAEWILENVKKENKIEEV